MSRGHGPIGLAVTARDVRLAQRLSGGGYAYGCEALSDEVDPASPAYHTETSRAISKALREGAFVGKEVVSALPAELLRYKTLRMPPMPEEDLAQAIAWEAAERFQLTDDQSLQYYTAGEVHQGNERREEVILLAAEKQGVYDHAIAVKRAGLLPSVIDATGAALARLLGEQGKSTLVIHLGANVAEIVGAKSEQVIFDKPIDLDRKNDVIDLAALSREIGLCARYLSVTFGVHKPNAAWVCGEGATPELCEALADAMHTPLKTVGQSPVFGVIDYPGDDAGLWAIALGLAARGTTGAAWRGAA